MINLFSFYLLWVIFISFSCYFKNDLICYSYLVLGGFTITRCKTNKFTFNCKFEILIWKLDFVRSRRLDAVFPLIKIWINYRI